MDRPPARDLLRALGLVLALAAAPVHAAAPAKPEPPADEDCLACHETPARLAESVHGQAGLACVDCHADLAKAADLPHADSLAKVECASCHDAQGAEYAKGIHAQAHIRAADSPAATCKDCHGSHEVLPAKDKQSLTYHLSLPQTCGRCHGDAETIKRGKIRIGNVPALFEDSIHGKALREKGLVVAPNCGDCHGNHAILRARDKASGVHRTNVPATCGRCHEGIRTRYEESVHWAAQRAGNPRAAVCIDCHSAHGIQSAELASWRLDVIRECGTCHEQSLHTYRDGFHGQVTALGFTRVATCSDCHGSHDILPKANPLSKVAPERRAATCGKCHAGASASFAKYDPHAEPGNRERNAALYYTSTFMKMLLFSVFAFFGLHTALWFPRELRLLRSRAVKAETKPEPEPPARAGGEDAGER